MVMQLYFKHRVKVRSYSRAAFLMCFLSALPLPSGSNFLSHPCMDDYYYLFNISLLAPSGYPPAWRERLGLQIYKQCGSLRWKCRAWEQKIPMVCNPLNLLLSLPNRQTCTSNDQSIWDLNLDIYIGLTYLSCIQWNVNVSLFRFYENSEMCSWLQRHWVTLWLVEVSRSQLVFLWQLYRCKSGQVGWDWGQKLFINRHIYIYIYSNMISRKSCQPIF